MSQTYYLFTNSLISIAFVVMTCITLALMVRLAYLDYLNQIWAILMLCAIILLAFLFIILISIQPMRTSEVSFNVPLVPILAGISIFVNVYLITVLDYYAWIRFGIWILLGNIYLLLTHNNYASHIE